MRRVRPRSSRRGASQLRTAHRPNPPVPPLGPHRLDLTATEQSVAALAGVDIAPVERMSFRSADLRFDVEAFLALPVGGAMASRTGGS